MSTPTMAVLLMAVGLATFLFRYSMIGLSARRKPPAWLRELCIHIAPASFATLTVGALSVHDGEAIPYFAAPETPAALIAALVAWRTGSVSATIGAGMAALHLLKLLF